MGPLSSRVYPEVLRSLAGSALTTSYQAVGTPLLFPCRMAKFTNATSEIVLISWDGINDHEALNIGESYAFNVSTNKESSQIFDCPQGTQFFAKAAAAGTGTFYISAYYGA